MARASPHHRVVGAFEKTPWAFPGYGAWGRLLGVLSNAPTISEALAYQQCAQVDLACGWYSMGGGGGDQRLAAGIAIELSCIVGYSVGLEFGDEGDRLGRDEVGDRSALARQGADSCGGVVGVGRIDGERADGVAELLILGAIEEVGEVIHAVGGARGDEE